MDPAKQGEESLCRFFLGEDACTVTGTGRACAYGTHRWHLCQNSGLYNVTYVTTLRYKLKMSRRVQALLSSLPYDVTGSHVKSQKT